MNAVQEELHFRIVESDYTREFYEMYARIKKDLSNGLKVKEIKQKYDLNDGKWRKYQKELVAEGLFEPRAISQKKAKFYTYTKGKYRVQKWKRNRKNHIGIFKLEEDAQKCVQLMKECNWDLEQKQRIVNQVKRESSYNYEGY